MKRLLWDKRFSGILWAVVLGAAFLMLSMLIVSFVSGIPWYLLSSMLRAAFGVIILMLGTRLYGKTTREILSLHNSKIAILSGLGFLVFLLCYVAASMSDAGEFQASPQGCFSQGSYCSSSRLPFMRN